MNLTNILKWELKNLLGSAVRPQVKLVVGAGYTNETGWIQTEIDTLNILKKRDWQKFARRNSITAIMAEHVWEHLSEQDGYIAAQNCYDHLERGGYFRIAIPDGLSPDPDYIEYVRPGGYGPGSNDHKVLYTYKTLTAMLEKAGFEVKLLEYFDENGQFHFNEWKKEDGFISRSKRYDERNAGGKLGYTSLIADAVKR